MKYMIGVDLGGTKINTVLIDKKGKVIKKIKYPTGKGKNNILKKILVSIEFVSNNMNKKDILGIGIGVPGVLRNEKIIKLPNIKGFENFDIKNYLSNKLKMKIKVENDSICMALGEFVFGNGKNFNNLVCVTLGTGVGGGIIINKKIYRGQGKASEFGHITIEREGLKCRCENKGCLEEYISVRAIKRIAKKLKIREDNIIKIQENAKKGNSLCKKVYDIAGTSLGIGLSDIVKILDPELILLGGGISNSGNLILKPAVNEMKKRIYFKIPRVKIVKLKDNAGAIGAACLFLK